MSDQSINSDRLLFECSQWLSAFHSPASRLREYEKQTGIMLAIQLVEQLDCDSGRIPCRRFHVQLLSASADSASVYRPDMSRGADRVFRLLTLTVFYSFFCPRIRSIPSSPLSSLYAPFSGSYTRIIVTSKYIRLSRTSVPVMMGPSICSSST